MFGIRQNLEITPIAGTDQYRIVAGHRRRLATLMLLEDGEPEEEFRYVPCRIVEHPDENEEKGVLLTTNIPMRQFDSYEYLEQYKQLSEVIKERKKTHHVPGRVIEHIAQVLGISTSQVERISIIDKKLEPEFKEELKNGTISFNAAAELARLSPVDQKAVYEKHKETGATSLNNVREQRAKAKTNKPENKSDLVDKSIGEALAATFAEDDAKKKRIAEVENPTIKALLLVKLLLTEEIFKIGVSLEPEPNVSSEYKRILVAKLGEIEKELFALKGNDIFEMDTGTGV